MTNTWMKSDEITTRPWGDSVSELQCPRCGVANLHHSGVTVYDRGEDATTVVKTSVSNGKVAVESIAPGAGNPSLRRDGISIRFWCEGCGEEPIELTIGQHKGSTEIGWRYVPV